MRFRDLRFWVLVAMIVVNAWLYFINRALGDASGANLALLVVGVCFLGAFIDWFSDTIDPDQQ